VLHQHTHSFPTRRSSDLATGFGYTQDRRAEQAKILQELLPRVRDIRRMGSAALDLCRVAEGTVDAYYEHGVKIWDVAAGIVIARSEEHTSELQSRFDLVC